MKYIDLVTKGSFDDDDLVSVHEMKLFQKALVQDLENLQGKDDFIQICLIVSLATHLFTLILIAGLLT
jgi:hypothetical protein